MLTVTKILSLFVYPLSLGLFFVGLSLWGQLRGNRAAAGLCTFLAVAVLYFPSTQTGVEMIAAPLEARYPAFSPEELPNGDVIIVLAGGIEAEGQFGRWGDLNDAADRLFVGAELWKAQKAPRIAVSGGASRGSVPGAVRSRDVLLRLGVPSESILLEDTSLTTRAEAESLVTLLSGPQHVLLVTSALHMRRTAALFSAQGFKVTAVPTDHRVHQHSGFIPGWMPTVDHLNTSTAAVHEWVGYWVDEQLGRLAPADAESSSSDKQ
ncbi:YdcF family protein [bacterium]|nr:YdcF family protein [bacterium]